MNYFHNTLLSKKGKEQNSVIVFSSFQKGFVITLAFYCIESFWKTTQCLMVIKCRREIILHILWFEFLFPVTCINFFVQKIVLKLYFQIMLYKFFFLRKKRESNSHFHQFQYNALYMVCQPQNLVQGLNCHCLLILLSFQERLCYLLYCF